MKSKTVCLDLVVPSESFQCAKSEKTIKVTAVSVLPMAPQFLKIFTVWIDVML